MHNQRKRGALAKEMAARLEDAQSVWPWLSSLVRRRSGE